MAYFIRGTQTLTPIERAIDDAYLLGTPTKEIMSELNIWENTLKFHHKNLYGKLGVSSRKQLLEVYRAIKADRQTNEDQVNIIIRQVKPDYQRANSHRENWRAVSYILEK